MPAPSAPRYSDPSVRERLPPEIRQFLRGPAPITLTLRGPPGSGKTSFAMAILDQFDGYRALLTTRVSRAGILNDHPWVRETRPAPIDIFERLRFRVGPEGTTLHVDRLRETLQARASDLVDLAPILSLPDELATAFRAHPGAPKIVGIDSWEAWIENVIGPTPLALDVPTTRWELERSMLDQFREAGAHVVLVVEREEQARLDFITDGAVALSYLETDGRAERWISFQKLRGTRLASASYPFTLEGGRFQSIPMAPYHMPFAPIPDERDPGPTVAGLWPGATALAVRFGRLPAPGTTLIEADGETPERLLWRLVVPIVAASIRSGGRAVVLPPSHIPASEVQGSLRPLRDGPLPGGLRLLADPNLPPGTGTSIDPPVADDPEEAREISDMAEAARFLRQPAAATARSLLVLFLEPGGPGTDDGMPEARPGRIGVLRTSVSPVATVLVDRTSDPAIEPIRARSSVHLHVRASRGQFFVIGIRPWTPNVVLARPPPDEEVHRPYDLIPIV